MSDHRRGCTFGTGFYRIVLSDGGVRYCQTTSEVEFIHHLLPQYAIKRVQRDGYCLDQDDLADPNVIDGAAFLAMPREQAMRDLQFTDAEYARAYAAIEEAVVARDRKAADGGDFASVVIKKRGTRVLDVTL